LNQLKQCCSGRLTPKQGTGINFVFKKIQCWYRHKCCRVRALGAWRKYVVCSHRKYITFIDQFFVCSNTSWYYERILTAASSSSLVAALKSSWT
jgi:hypothetical protein